MRRTFALLAATGLLFLLPVPAQANGVDSVTGRGTTPWYGSTFEFVIAASDATPGTNGEDGRGRVTIRMFDASGAKTSEDTAQVVCASADGHIGGVLAKIDRGTYLEYHVIRVWDGGPGNPDHILHDEVWTSTPFESDADLYDRCVWTPNRPQPVTEGNFKVQDGT